MPTSGLPSAPGAPVLNAARAEASRRNGAKSKGPKTPKGKARSARNALRHGMRAERYVVLPDEDEAAFKAIEAGLIEELAPQGALEMALARRVVAATWRLERAERLESELFVWHGSPRLGHGGLAVALLRDCNGARAFDTLLRYRGGARAELWRALRTLKALQAERQAQAVERTARPSEPETRKNPGDSDRPVDPAAADRALAWLPTWPFPPSPATMPGPAPGVRPSEPESRAMPAMQPSVRGVMTGPASLLAGTALVPPGRRNAG